MTSGVGGTVVSIEATFVYIAAQRATASKAQLAATRKISRAISTKSVDIAWRWDGSTFIHICAIRAIAVVTQVTTASSIFSTSGTNVANKRATGNASAAN